MSAFRSLKRDCPICGGIRKDCRQNTITNLIHCRHGESNPLGYVLRGEDKIGFFIWAEAREVEAQSAEKREEWRREQEARKQQRLEAEAKRKAEALDLETKDRLYRETLAQLTLHPEDRADLVRRGFTDEEIERSGFKSVGKWQRLDREFDSHLPGVGIDGRSLIVQPGYLCPLRDPDGHITSMQIRLRGDAEGGRYRWLSSDTKNRPNGQSPRIGDELPLGVHRPKKVIHPGKIGFCEGTAAKPFLAAERLKMVFIGASGGQWHLSPQLLRLYLEQLSDRAGGIDECILYPDAGSRQNAQMMRNYRALKDLLTSWGYKVTIAWWNQHEKSNLDIDELAATDYENIEYLSWEQFSGDKPEPHEPKHQPQAIEPDREEYKAYCDHIEEEEKAAEAQEVESCSQWVKNVLSKLVRGTAKRVRRLQRAGRTADASAIAQPKLHTLKYVSGSLPSPKDAEALGYPKISFGERQRHQIWSEAVEKGWQHIQDISAPGLGKSYEAGNARVSDFEVNKIFYFASNHRNPTVATIEAEFVDVRVRNSGLLEDPTRLTPLGNPYIVWPKNEPPNLPGNCHKTEVFSLLRKKNFTNLEGSSGEDSPVCANCHLLNACKGSEGAGFGAKHQRQEDLAHPRNRLHPDSAPDTSEFNFAQTVNFWDEAGTLINAMSSVSVALPDFDKLWGDLEQRSPEIHSQLADLRLKLRPLLAKELKQPFRGWDDAAVRALLPTPPENLADIICELELNSPDLNEFIEPLDGVEFTSAQSSEERRMLKRLNQSLRQETYRQSRKNLEDLPLNWLIPFLKVWNGEAGSLRSDFGILSIFSRNTRHSDVAKASKSNIYLDATENPQNLALKLGIQANELLLIEQETPTFENLRIIQVGGFGILSKDRSDSLKERLAIFKDELKRRHPDIAFLEWLTHADEGDGAHFREGRGSNQYLEVSALAGFGVPFQNLGHLQALYQTLTGQQATLDGNDPEFQHFVDTHVQGEVVQEVGRLRAHLRQSERLTYYFVGDYDLNFLKEAYPGASIESVEAYSISPQAGTATQQVRARILDAWGHLTQAGEKVTTTAIAEIANVSQGRVSQIASDFGGWAVFKKLLASLYTSLYRKTNNSPEASDPDNQWFAATYLPLVVSDNPDPIETVNAVLVMARAVGSKVFEQILAIATPATKAELLLKMMDILPIEMQREIIGESTS